MNPSLAPSMGDSTPISPAELHLMYILLDSNLPTGGFVSSSGLESFAKHGLLSASGVSGGWSSKPVGTTSGLPAHGIPAGMSANSSASAVAAPSPSRPPTIPERLVWFSEDAVRNYARSTAGVVADAWRSLDRLGGGAGPSWKGKAGADATLVDKTSAGDPTLKDAVDAVVQAMKTLDAYYESLTLNHVVKRSSMAQGIALLTLLAKGFSEPGYMAASSQEDVRESTEAVEDAASIKEAKRLVLERFRKAIRKGEAAGHLPVCWGLLASASGLSLGMCMRGKGHM